METIREFIVSGRIVDLMLAVMLLEVTVLLLRQARTARGARALPLIANAGAGISLMLALRNTLTGGSWQALAGCLIAALAFHVLDVFLRWRSPAAGNPAQAENRR